MRAIILAAGLSRRFRDEGYMTPKPFLQIEWRGTIAMMLEHVINTIPMDFSVAAAIPLGWLSSTKKISHEHNQIVYSELGPTKGPADTALQMLELFKSDDTIFMDVDILNLTNDLSRLSFLTCCGVLVRSSTNAAFSYVDELGEFKLIAEKKRISPYAVQGAYYVPASDRDAFIEKAKEIIPKVPEPYLSHVFSELDVRKYAIKTTYTPIEWGTPRDVRISGAQFVGGNHVRDRGQQRS